MTAPRFSLSVQYADATAGLPDRSTLRRWVRKALERDAVLTIRLVGAEEARSLNREYRGRDYATNVLTFAYGGDAVLEGDIAVCVPVVLEEAAQQGKAVKAHWAHLVVHGVLHLQGYDHEDDAEARRMEARETQIVTELGYPDPYRMAA